MPPTENVPETFQLRVRDDVVPAVTVPVATTSTGGSTAGGASAAPSFSTADAFAQGGLRTCGEGRANARRGSCGGGGDGTSQATGIAIDDTKAVYLVGTTTSTDFPKVGAMVGRPAKSALRP
jgi:hypothetical protein